MPVNLYESPMKVRDCYCMLLTNRYSDMLGHYILKRNSRFQTFEGLSLIIYHCNVKIASHFVALLDMVSIESA